jgi:hypothetical protein
MKDGLRSLLFGLGPLRVVVGISEQDTTGGKHTLWTSVIKSSTRSSFVLASCRWRSLVLKDT